MTRHPDVLDVAPAGGMTRPSASELPERKRTGLQWVQAAGGDPPGAQRTGDGAAGALPNKPLGSKAPASS